MYGEGDRKLSTEQIDLSKMSREEILEGIKSGKIKSEKYTIEEYNEKFGHYAHFIDIHKDNHIVRIHYNYNIHLDSIMEFEGRRLQSFHAKDTELPSFDERVWDKERKITVRRRE